MIEFTEHILSNGLQVLVHEDKSTPMIAVNLLYKVGSKDEREDRTGLAHLFEHLMFGGSKNVPEFDDPIQLAGGENNAFTNSDLTNYYNIVPAANIETIMWLESDRMANLIMSQKALDIQRKVVLEEFSETCLDEPYGDAWHHLMALCYKNHAYRWPTIGLVPKHVAEVTLDEVKSFFDCHYSPSNAIMTIGGNISFDKAVKLVEKWFGDIENKQVSITKPMSIYEPPQVEERRKIVKADVPARVLYMAFHMGDRLSKEYYATDLMTDILSNGRSSRFFKNLYRGGEIFSSIDAFISGTMDPGLVIIEGRLNDDMGFEEAEEAIWAELTKIKVEAILPTELQKVKNKLLSSLEFSEVNILNKTINLAYFKNLGDAHLINDQMKLYNQVTVEDIQRISQQILRKENSSVLWYDMK